MEEKEKGSEDKIIERAYVRLFSSSDGRVVMEDMRRISGVDEPFGVLDENDLRHRAAWQDFYKTIEEMSKGE